jgi:hypothetical protein
MKLKTNQKEVFTEMFNRMKALYPEIKASPDELDPVVRMLLHAFSGEVAEIHSNVNDLWDTVFDQFRDYMLWNDYVWSIPAATVCKVEPTDNKVVVTPDLKLIYQSPRANEPPLFFAPLKEHSLRMVNAAHLFCFRGNKAYYRNGLAYATFKSLDRLDDEGCHQWEVTPDDFHEPEKQVLLIGIEYDGAAAELTGNPLYISGSEEVGKFLQRGLLHAASAHQPVRRPRPFMTDRTISTKDYDALAIGNNIDFEKHFYPYFLQLPAALMEGWKPMAKPYQVELLSRQLEEAELKNIGTQPCYWLEIILPGQKQDDLLDQLRGLDFNCFVTINREEVRYISFWGENRNLEVTLPESYREIYRIDGVVDSDGAEYYSIFDMEHQDSDNRFNVHVHEETVTLEINSGDTLKPTPEKITIIYSKTGGRRGNGIKAFLIEKLFQSHPGVSRVYNVNTTLGGVEANAPRHYEKQFSGFLKARGQVIGKDDIATLAELLGLEVENVEISRTVVAGRHGPSYGSKISIKAANLAGLTDTELEVCKARLADIIDQSSPINVKCLVEIV